MSEAPGGLRWRLTLDFEDGEIVWQVRMIGGTSGNPELEQKMLKAMMECFELWCRKQHDYGSQNIARGGIPGILVRMQDKIARRLNLGTGVSKVLEDPRRDSWRDLTNYGLMGLLLEDGEWPALTEAETVTEEQSLVKEIMALLEAPLSRTAKQESVEKLLKESRQVRS